MVLTSMPGLVAECASLSPPSNGAARVPIYLPLRTGTKVCSVPGWNEPGYPGVSSEAEPADAWLGLRLDDLVVIDADCACAKVNGRKPDVCETQWAAVEAVQAWREHGGTETWMRKTPHGFHIFYRRLIADAGRVTTRKLFDISPTLELKTGIAAYVVFSAPGYFDLNDSRPQPFDAAWLPEQARTAHIVDEWSELPDGIGDSFMISVAGKLREWGADVETIRHCLDGINVVTMSRSPMPYRSIRRIAASAARYAPGDVADLATFDCPTCSTKWEGS